MPYFSIMTPSGNKIGPFSVCITKTNDATWTKDVIELAQFETREQAEAFRESLKALLKIYKPTKIGITV
jgi:hypothetical protein